MGPTKNLSYVYLRTCKLTDPATISTEYSYMKWILFFIYRHLKMTITKEFELLYMLHHDGCCLLLKINQDFN